MKSSKLADKEIIAKLQNELEDKNKNITNIGNAFAEQEANIEALRIQLHQL